MFLLQYFPEELKIGYYYFWSWLDKQNINCFLKLTSKYLPWSLQKPQKFGHYLTTVNISRYKSTKLLMLYSFQPAITCSKLTIEALE